MRRACYVFALLLLVVAPGRAAEFFIATNGSDSNACSQSAPCATFSKGMGLLKAAGDTLTVRGGTYTQRVQTAPAKLRGTASKYIVIRAYQNEEVWIKPSNTVEAFTVTDARYLEIDGINVNGENLGGGGGTYGISVNWRPGPYGSDAATQFIRIKNVKIHNMRNLSADAQNSQGFQVFADDVTISHSEVDGTHRQGNDRQGSHCVYAAGPGNRITVEYSIFRNCGGYGVQYNDSGNAGGSDGNVGSIFRYNTIEQSGYREGSGGGLTIYHHQRGVQVYGNRIVDNSGPGVNVEGGTNQDVQVINNTIVGNTNCFTGGSDASHPATHMDFSNNICSGNGSGFRMGAYGSNGMVRNNIFNDPTPYRNDSTGVTKTGNKEGVDPKFMSLSGSTAEKDLHLQDSSPGKGAGLYMSAVTTDRDGKAYPNPPDMGAYSTGASEIPEPPDSGNGESPPTPTPAPAALDCTGDLGAQGKITLRCTPVEESKR